MNVPRFNAGQALTASDLNRLSDAIRANRITGFVGGRIEINPSGTSLIADQKAGGGGGTVATEAMPFEVLLAPVQSGDDPARVWMYIYGESFLMKDQNEHDFVTITGVNTTYSRFRLPEPPGAIVLDITFDNAMQVTSAVRISDLITYWQNYPHPIERDTEAEGVYYLRQKKLRIPIAEVVAETDPRSGTVYTDNGVQKKVVQLVTTDLMMAWEIVDGMAGIIARPWSRRPALST